MSAAATLRTDERRWDDLTPVPPGSVTLLEASAGTGKTWQIASLVARLVALDGLPIDRVLVMTFTNAATAELRGRIRGRLAEVEQALRAAIAGEPHEHGADRVLSALVDDGATDSEGQPAPPLTTRLQRLQAALAGLDAAPISTIHGFSQRMLDAFSLETGEPVQAALREDVAPLREQLVDDVLTDLYARLDADALDGVVAALGDRDALLRLAKAVTGAIAPRLLPAGPRAVDLASLRAVVDLAAEAAAAGADPVATALMRWHASMTDDSAPPPWTTTALTDETLVTALMDDLRQLEGAPAASPDPTQPAGEALSPLAGATAGQFKSNVRKLVAGAADGTLTIGKGRPGELAAGLVAVLRDAEGQRGHGDGQGSGTVSGAHPATEALVDAICAGFDERAALRCALASVARVTIDRSLRERGEVSFSTMLSRLAEQIATTGPDGPLAVRIRERFDAALIDEFQDTDAAQWQVLRAAFADRPRKRLVLIGDPKQAIYRFRGADIHVYRSAKLAVPPARRFTMGTNHRSDAAVIAGIEKLWQPGGQRFGAASGFDFVSVQPSDRHAGRALVALAGGQNASRDNAKASADDTPGVHVVHIDGLATGRTDEAGAPLHPTSKDDARRLVCADVAARVSALLRPGAYGIRPTPGGQTTPLQAADIAVLVRTGHEAQAVQRALRDRGVFAVLSATGSVFESAAANWLLDWLLAEAAPDRTAGVRRLAHSPLVGLEASALMALHDDLADEATRERWLALRASLQPAPTEPGRPATPWRFAERWQAFLATHGALPRLLRLDDGERLATDLRHLGELLHREDRRRHPGPEGLAQWLQRAMEADGSGGAGGGGLGGGGLGGDALGADAAKLRLESDGDAVRIVTVHSAKGLEYPVVFAPFLWSDEGSARRVHGAFEAPDDHADPVLSLHDKADPRRAVWMARRAAEARAEGMRLLYVAMTRAANHLVLHYAPCLEGVEHAPLTTLLLGEGQDPLRGAVDVVRKPGKTSAGDHEAAWQALQARVGPLPNVALERAAPPPAPTHVHVEVETEVEIEAENEVEVDATRPAPAPLHHERLATGWWRASFTSIIGGASGGSSAGAAQQAEHSSRGAGDEPEEAIERDENDAVTHPLPDTDTDTDTHANASANASANANDPRWHQDVPLADIPGGKAFGNWLHGALELLDFQTRTERGSGLPMQALLEREARRHGADEAQAPAVTQQLHAVLDTPLDGDARLGLPAGQTLGQLSLADRRDELRFEVPLAGGARWRAGDRRTSGWALVRALQDRAAREGPAWAGSAWVASLTAAGPTAEQGDAAANCPPLPALSGMLTGFVDLVFRVGERWYVADYKGSRLSLPGDRRRSPLSRYGTAGLAEDMAGHGYHLQGLLYTLALHRLLRLRLGEAYEPARHLGGLLYLYLRGMPGADAPRLATGLAPGVFVDRWPDDVLARVDQIFAAEAA